MNHHGSHVINQANFGRRRPMPICAQIDTRGLWSATDDRRHSPRVGTW